MTVAERVRKHRQSQKDKGLVEVRVWVPKGDESLIRAVARKLITTPDEDKDYDGND